jgi:hypothetical protein
MWADLFSGCIGSAGTDWVARMHVSLSHNREAPIIYCKGFFVWISHLRHLPRHQATRQHHPAPCRE